MQRAPRTVALGEPEASLSNLTGRRHSEGDVHFPRRVSVLQTAPGHSRASGGPAERGRAPAGYDLCHSSQTGPTCCFSHLFPCFSRPEYGI